MTLLQWYRRLDYAEWCLGEPVEDYRFHLRRAAEWWWSYHALCWGIHGRPSSAGPPDVERWHP